MKFEMIVEPIPGIGYRATGASGLAIGLCAEGLTDREASRKLSQQVTARVAAGARLVEMESLGRGTVLMLGAGSLKEEPLLEAWKEAMRENRRIHDSEEALRDLHVEVPHAEEPIGAMG
jgi:hypothetical protein